MIVLRLWGVSAVAVVRSDRGSLPYGAEASMRMLLQGVSHCVVASSSLLAEFDS